MNYIPISIWTLEQIKDLIKNFDAKLDWDFKKNPVVFCKDHYTLWKVLDALDPNLRKNLSIPGVFGTDIYLKQLHDHEYIKIEDFEDSVLIESNETNSYIQIYDRSGSGEFPIDNYTEIKFNANTKLEALRQGYLAGIGLFDPEVSFEEVINDLQIDGMLNDYDYEKLITANEIELWELLDHLNTGSIVVLGIFHNNKKVYNSGFGLDDFVPNDPSVFIESNNELHDCKLTLIRNQEVDTEWGLDVNLEKYIVELKVGSELDALRAGVLETATGGEVSLYCKQFTEEEWIDFIDAITWSKWFAINRDMTAEDIINQLEEYPPFLGSGNPILTNVEYDGKELYSVDKENLEQKLKDEFEESEYKETEDARMEWQAENEASVLIEGYKWVFDTIMVYVSDTRNGNGWEQEIPVVNNSISDSIKDYKKSLGPGYWIEYLGPGKMHKNKDFREDINDIKKPIYERDGKKAFEIPSDMTLEDFETFVDDLSISSPADREAVLDLSDLREVYGDKGMRYILCLLDNKDVFILVIDNRFHGESELSDIVNCSGEDFRYHIKTMLLNPFIAEVLKALGAEVSYDYNRSAVDTILEFSKVYRDNKEAVYLVLDIIRFLKFNHPFDYEETVTLQIINLFTKDPKDLIDNLNYEIEDTEDEPSIHAGQQLIDKLNDMFDSSIFIESNK